MLLFSLIYPISSHALNDASYKISWCSSELPSQVEINYLTMKSILERRTTLMLPEKILSNNCEPGSSNIWWFDTKTFQNFNLSKLREHISNAGVFIVEGFEKESLDLSADSKNDLNKLNDYSIGLLWENPSKNGMFYRSFYLIQSLDGCPIDNTKVLMLRKKINAQAPIGVLINTHFLDTGDDCFKDNQDYKIRSFINIMFAFITTDYKEDQRELPEILNRIRNLGLEP